MPRLRRSSGRDALCGLADEELMLLVARGESAAFEMVYERHSGPAFSLAYRMVGSRSGAEDVVQEAFLSAWRGGSRFDGDRGSLRTWLLGIVHHRAIDHLRRAGVQNRGRVADGSDAAEAVPSPERTDVEVARRDEAAGIRTALAELPDEQSRVIELAYFGGFTHQEIAQMLGAPLGTIKGRMRLGLEKMRGRLAPEAAI